MLFFLSVNEWHNKGTILFYVSAVVSPASDAHFCRKMSLTEWWEKCRRVRKEGVIAFRGVTTHYEKVPCDVQGAFIGFCLQ
mgnify:CR=1 FL=1